jgi:DNA-binding transcriptional LysR family regulator
MVEFPMETNRLRQFCAIVETGSISNASRLLHISHSGLSKSMKLLQEEAGCVLLQPAGRGLELTEAGRVIYQRAKEFIQHEERLFALDKKPVQTTIRIGALGIFLLPLAAGLKEFPLNFPTVALMNFAPGNMEQSIANRQLDFGITNAPCPEENLDIIELGKYQSGCYHLRGTFEGQKLSNIPFVVPDHGLLSNPLGVTALDGWPENYYPREKKFLVNLFLTAIELALQGVCAIYIPDFVASQINASRSNDNQLVEYPLSKEFKISHRAFLMKHKEQGTGLGCDLLCHMLRKVIVG